MSYVVHNILEGFKKFVTHFSKIPSNVANLLFFFNPQRLELNRNVMTKNE